MNLDLGEEKGKTSRRQAGQESDEKETSSFKKGQNQEIRHI